MRGKRVGGECKGMKDGSFPWVRLYNLYVERQTTTRTLDVTKHSYIKTKCIYYNTTL